jgi:hypothetical protein
MYGAGQHIFRKFFISPHCVVYPQYFAIPPSCREYFRDRPRGEFLTRGAALSSQGGNNGGGAGGGGRTAAESRDGRGGATAGGHDYGSNQRYMAAAASQAARLGRNLSSEKLVSQPEQQQRQRHPTILRKSEFRDQLILQ